MALGQRLVADLLAEISFHLLEPITVQTLASPIGPGSPSTITLAPSSSATLPAAPLAPTQYLYPGALVVVGWQSLPNVEVTTVLTVLSPTAFTANLVNAHLAGETLFAPTFPTQRPTDPIFSQLEIIGYIAQAQNEFLTKTPFIFQLFPNLESLIGQTYQTLPGTAIELERVAVQSTPDATTFPLASISRTGGTVTAVLASSANSDQWTPQLQFLVQGVTDPPPLGFPTFNSVNNATFTLLSISPDGLTLTWSQGGPDGVGSGGALSRPILTRLYESSQEQIGMNQPWWGSQQGTPPTAFFEDRSGIYGWGLAFPPASNFYFELLCSVRGPEGLTLLSNFLIPDIFVYAIKWRVLAYCWSKDGVQRSPTMERFAKGKFDFYCLLADRFLRNVIDKTGAAGAAAGGNF